MPTSIRLGLAIKSLSVKVVNFYKQEGVYI
jgi:hypothetical protein